jgi:hypothetical protein
MGTSLCAFHHQQLGSYVVSIVDVPVFSVSDIDSCVSRLLLQLPVPATVEIVLAPEHHSAFNDHPAPLHCICALQSVSGEGMTSDSYCSLLDAFATALTDVEMSEAITSDGYCSSLDAFTSALTDVEMSEVIH